MSDKTKKVIFSIPENNKARFKVQLQYDSLTQAQFFRGVLDGYEKKDIDFMKFIANLKNTLGVQSKPQIKKTAKNLDEARQTTRSFALEDDEVEGIFDMLEQEHPEL